MPGTALDTRLYVTIKQTKPLSSCRLHSDEWGGTQVSNQVTSQWSTVVSATERNKAKEETREHSREEVGLLYKEGLIKPRPEEVTREPSVTHTCRSQLLDGAENRASSQTHT